MLIFALNQLKNFDVNDYGTANKPENPRSLSPLDELFIKLVRIRKTVNEKMLAELFCISKSIVKLFVH